MSLFKKQMPTLIIAILTILFIFEFYFNVPSVTPLISSLNTNMLLGGVMIGYFAIMLGSITLSKYHITRVFRREKNQWIYSLTLLVSFIITSVVGIVLSPTSEIYTWIYNNLNITLVTAVASLGLFWLLSTVYRSFQVKNIESLLMFVAFFIVLVGAVPIGGFLSPMQQWVNQVPTKGPSIGILITGAIGTIVFCYRVMIGREKGALGIEE